MVEKRNDSGKHNKHRYDSTKLILEVRVVVENFRKGDLVPETDLHSPRVFPKISS